MPDMADQENMQQTNANGPGAEVPDSSDHNIDKIRKLLFGSQMREYDRRLEELTGRIDQRVDQQREEQSARLNKFEELIRGELQRMSTQLKQERQARATGLDELGDLVKELRRSLAPQIEALDERLSKEVMEIRGELRDQASELLDSLYQRHRELSESLERERARLQDEKTSRDEMAQLFSELALRLNREFDLPEC